jgi:hypothetical protein
MRLAASFITSVGGVFVVSLVGACGAVPDLRFGDDGDASIVVSTDATIPTTTPTAEASTPVSGVDDSSPSAPPGDDSSAAPPGDDASFDSAPPPNVDANVPPDATSPAVCPNHPPFGASCCGVMECRPNGFTPCDCTTCDMKCTTTQVCCIDKTSKFEACADTLADCPKP